jgi:hypothetical protein
VQLTTKQGIYQHAKGGLLRLHAVYALQVVHCMQALWAVTELSFKHGFGLVTLVNNVFV